MAQIVSYLFHPVFMPLLGIVVIFNSGVYVVEIPFEFKKFVFILVLLCTVVLPLTLIPALFLFKMVQNFRLDTRQERILPLIFTTVCFYLAYFLITKHSPVRLINLFLFACVVIVLLNLAVSIFWKISIHMAGIGGMVALISILAIAYVVDVSMILTLSILLSGLIATARLALRAHTPWQIAAGFMLGFLGTGGAMFPLLV